MVAASSVYNSVTGDQVIGFSKPNVVIGRFGFGVPAGEANVPVPVLEIVLDTAGVETCTVLAIPEFPVWRISITIFEVPSHAKGVAKVCVFKPAVGA